MHSVCLSVCLSVCVCVCVCVSVEQVGRAAQGNRLHQVPEKQQQATQAGERRAEVRRGCWATRRHWQPTLVDDVMACLCSL